MTKEERRAEKIRVLVQSGSLFADAARAMRDTTGLSLESALQCVFVAEVTHELQGVQYDLAEIKRAVEGQK